MRLDIYSDIRGKWYSVHVCTAGNGWLLAWGRFWTHSASGRVLEDWDRSGYLRGLGKDVFRIRIATLDNLINNLD
jgi:hypothetical protein